MRTPQDHAHEIEPRCRSYSEDEAAPYLARQNIDSVEPAYSYVHTASNAREAHFRGAQIHLRPLPSMTRESIARALECHEMRAILSGNVQANDPYVMPERWIDLDVESERDGFVVLVRTDDITDARHVLERARGLAAP